MFVETCILDPSSAESQGRVILFDVAKKGFCFRVSERDRSAVEIFHVMGAVDVILDDTPCVSD